MSEAPEKIRTNAAGNAIVTPQPVWDTDVEYIRADHVDALLKQAREDALRETLVAARKYRYRRGEAVERTILALIEKENK